MFLGFVLGIYVSIHFSYLLAGFFSENMGWDTQYVNLIAFAITFVLIVFLISLAGRVLTKIAVFAALGLVNKFLGGAFGLIKVAFLASVVIMFFKATNEEIDIISEESLERSALYEPIESIAPILLPSILREAEKRDILEDFDEITEKTEARD